VATAPPRRRYAPRLPRAERRRQVLDVTLDLIAADGYAGVTMERVAREAGVTKPVVYDVFPNRGELLRALLEREEQRALGELTAVLGGPAEGEDPDDFLVAVVIAFLEVVLANPQAWRLILLPTEGTPEMVREHVARGRAGVARTLEALVGWGIRTRGGPQVDVEIAAQAILTLAEGAGRMVLTHPERYTPERIGSFTRSVIGALSRSP
jgi:AcrR family transcriptional regulator